MERNTEKNKEENKVKNKEENNKKDQRDNKWKNNGKSKRNTKQNKKKRIIYYKKGKKKARTKNLHQIMCQKIKTSLTISRNLNKKSNSLTLINWRIKYRIITLLMKITKQIQMIMIKQIQIKMIKPHICLMIEKMITTTNYNEDFFI